ncbi:unnamed protein product [Nezara viridula]|uniref:Uncharacterized protein n=1 Tax=Nezara viridula TaxID=85310 RepID=A0A9P0HCM5_NEZVI|nr:unnamed protein product [Nezara viridula]
MWSHDEQAIKHLLCHDPSL